MRFGTAAAVAASPRSPGRLRERSRDPMMALPADCGLHETALAVVRFALPRHAAPGRDAPDVLVAPADSIRRFAAHHRRRARWDRDVQVMAGLLYARSVTAIGPGAHHADRRRGAGLRGADRLAAAGWGAIAPGACWRPSRPRPV
jgi:hypothetical protein